MSTTAMWLLLAVVVIVILFASVLYKRTFTTKELAMTGVMAALSLVAYLFFRVPFYGGSSFHLGNTFTALTALLLDGVSGGLAGDPGYAVTTFVLKFIIGITCGAVAHKAFKLRDLDKHSSGYLVKVIVSAGSGLLLNVLTDPFLGYFRNVYIFGLGIHRGTGADQNCRRRHLCKQRGLHRVCGHPVPRPASGPGACRSAAQGRKTLSDLSILIQHCCPHLPDFSYPPAVGAAVFFVDDLSHGTPPVSHSLDSPLGDGAFDRNRNKKALVTQFCMTSVSAFYRKFQK